MRRFFHPAPLGSDSVLVLEGTEAKHAARVTRLQTGDRAIVLDGRGSVMTCEAVEVGRHRVVFSVLESVKYPKPKVGVRLCQALIKGKAFDQVLQKSVELGVTEIVPFVSERSVAVVQSGDGDGKLEKWQQTVVEALKQCGAAWMPHIHPPCTFEEAVLKKADNILPLVASLQPLARHLRSVVDEFWERQAGRPEMVSLWIGPEGDFTDAEYQRLMEAGAKPVRLGEHTLRSETAAICGLSLIQHELTAPRPDPLTGPTP